MAKKIIKKTAKTAKKVVKKATKAKKVEKTEKVEKAEKSPKAPVKHRRMATDDELTQPNADEPVDVAEGPEEDDFFADDLDKE